jgi:biofilm PGA synthesis protein PgaA
MRFEMRWTRRARWLRCSLLVAAVCTVPAIASAQKTREDAVQAARRGEFDAAVSALRALSAASPSDTAIAFDLAVVLEWAARPREATDVFEHTGVAEPPEYVLGAMLRAYRTQRRWVEAGALAAQGTRRFPADPQWAVAGWMARGDEAIASGDQFAALGAYLHAAQLAPGDAGIAREVSGILVRLGAPFGAGLHVQTRDLGIEAGQAAALVTAAEVGDPAQRFAKTDEAIARIDALLADAAAATPPDAGLLLRLRRDRVIALRDRGHWAATAEGVAALRKDGNAIPPYVRHAEADALLALRRPEDAATAYGEVLAADPSLRSARVGLFFARLEQEDIHGALALVDAMAAEGGPKRGTSANWEWLDAQLLAAVARYYAGQPREAWHRLQPLVEGAPALGFLRSAKAQIAAARGWPRLADEESHIATTLAPPDRATEIELAEAALSRKRFDEAESRTVALVTVYPEDQGVERLRQEMRANDAVELRVESETRSEHGSAADSPGSGYDVRTSLFSPPFLERWRLKAGYEFSQATPVEGVIRRARYGAGVEAQWPDATLEATAWMNTGTLDRAGGQVAASWQFGDHVQVSGDGERYAAETPLRATFYGISADAGSGEIAYSWDSTTAVAASVRRLWFTDGNDRIEASTHFVARLVERPDLTVDVRPELWWGSNTRPDAPYFNPKQSTSADMGVAARHLLWRRYERSLYQEFRLSAGAFVQEAYPTHWTGSVGYEQALRFTNDSTLHYGVGWARRVYDGEPVGDLRFYVNLGHRFD